MGERPEYEIFLQQLAEEDGGGFLATVPDLPGCMSDGETALEATLNVQDAIECWLEGAHERSEDPPASVYRRVVG